MCVCVRVAKLVPASPHSSPDHPSKIISRPIPPISVGASVWIRMLEAPVTRGSHPQSSPTHATQVQPSPHPPTIPPHQPPRWPPRPVNTVHIPGPRQQKESQPVSGVHDVQGVGGEQERICPERRVISNVGCPAQTATSEESLPPHRAKDYSTSPPIGCIRSTAVSTQDGCGVNEERRPSLSRSKPHRVPNARALTQLLSLPPHVLPHQKRDPAPVHCRTLGDARSAASTRIIETYQVQRGQHGQQQRELSTPRNW